jgi:hypothetical protein
MKRTERILILVVVAGAAGIVAGVTGLAGLASPALAGGEIHGTVITEDGERITGAIRWDRNENFWDDPIDASKTERVWARDRSEGVDFRIFGIRFLRAGGPRRLRTHSQFSIPFGHLAAVEPRAGGRARLELKNGETLEVLEGADLGHAVRGIVVRGPGGKVELEWEDLERVEFTAAPGTGLDEKRLYGTVETTVGDFTGYVVWDKDEALTTDILDGEEDDQDREVPFADIAGIEKLGRRSSRVHLRSGEVMDLRGTNDVDDDNRGIDIGIENLGQATVEWDEFRRVTFTDPPPSPRYDDFDGGRRLRGTVTTRDDEVMTGEIVWDKDERYTWEALDGEIQNVSFGIRFEHIDRIERVSRRAAKVVLKDGLELTLRESNDVNDKNKGIVVTGPDGEERVIHWNDFVSVDFAD